MHDMEQQTTNIKSEYTTPWVKVWDVKPNVAVMSDEMDNGGEF